MRFLGQFLHCSVLPSNLQVGLATLFFFYHPPPLPLPAKQPVHTTADKEKRVSHTVGTVCDPHIRKLETRLDKMGERKEHIAIFTHWD